MSIFFLGWPRKVLLSLCFMCWAFPAPGQGKEFDVTTNHWLVEVVPSGEDVARRVARDTGFTYVGSVSTVTFVRLLLSALTLL